MGSLDGKIALVTGASRGMGKQMALELAALTGPTSRWPRTTAASESNLPGTIGETVGEIRALGRRAEPIKVDLVNGPEVDAMVQQALDHFGHVDILVHSVQYHGPGAYDLFVDTTIEQLETQMWVNAMSAVRMCKVLVPHMAERGGGTIVLVTSGAGTFDTGKIPGAGAPGLGYPISKAALWRFIPALAKEVKDAGIAVIGLNPGMVYSEHMQVGSVGNDYHGWNIEMAAPMTMPAKACGYLVTHDDPMTFTGVDVDAPALVKEKQLA